jgi:hypothetical protein
VRHGIKKLLMTNVEDRDERKTVNSYCKRERPDRKHKIAFLFDK